MKNKIKARNLPTRLNDMEKKLSSLQKAIDELGNVCKELRNRSIDSRKVALHTSKSLMKQLNRMMKPNDDDRLLLKCGVKKKKILTDKDVARIKSRISMVE